MHIEKHEFLGTSLKQKSTEKSTGSEKEKGQALLYPTSNI